MGVWKLHCFSALNLTFISAASAGASRVHALHVAAAEPQGHAAPGVQPRQARAHVRGRRTGCCRRRAHGAGGPAEDPVPFKGKACCHHLFNLSTPSVLDCVTVLHCIAVRAVPSGVSEPGPGAPNACCETHDNTETVRTSVNCSVLCRCQAEGRCCGRGRRCCGRCVSSRTRCSGRRGAPPYSRTTASTSRRSRRRARHGTFRVQAL